MILASSLGPNITWTFFFSPGHHATPAQQQRATMPGWQLGKQMISFTETYQKGIGMVTKF